MLEIIDIAQAFYMYVTYLPAGHVDYAQGVAPQLWLQHGCGGGGGRSSSPRTTPHATRHAAHHTAYHTTRHTPHTTITPHATLHGPPPPHATPHATHHASPLATPHTTRHTGAAGWPNPAFVPTYITVATGNYILYWMGSKGLTLPLMTSGWRASHTRGEPWNDWLWLGDTHSHSPFLCCAAASD